MTVTVLIAGAVCSLFLAISLFFFVNSYEAGIGIMIKAWVFLIAAPLAFLGIVRYGLRLYRYLK
jgi:hypothetical protein